MSPTEGRYESEGRGKARRGKLTVVVVVRGEGPELVGVGEVAIPKLNQGAVFADPVLQVETLLAGNVSDLERATTTGSVGDSGSEGSESEGGGEHCGRGWVVRDEEWWR